MQHPCRSFLHSYCHLCLLSQVLLPSNKQRIQDLGRPIDLHFQENTKEKHSKDASNGWYRYDVRFGIPVYEENILVRYNIFGARLLINHAENGKKYLYDILAVKKETSKPHQ